MREQLLDALDHRDDLAVVDNDFVHLFSSWFNRGFLVLRRIDWSTPASVLEKIIRYEAVHAIRDWNDLRRRIDPPDRRCYAFFHPALIDEPLIFVEVALTREHARRDRADPLGAARGDRARPGDDRGVLFDLQLPARACRRVVRPFPDQAGGGGDRAEMPRLSTFVTLSPAPDFAEWLTRERDAEHVAGRSPARTAPRLPASTTPTGGRPRRRARGLASR